MWFVKQNVGDTDVRRLRAVTKYELSTVVLCVHRIGLAKVIVTDQHLRCVCGTVGGGGYLVCHLL